MSTPTDESTSPPPPTTTPTITTPPPSRRLLVAPYSNGIKKNYSSLFEECDNVLKNAARDMVEARELAERAGLTIDHDSSLGAAGVAAGAVAGEPQYTLEGIPVLRTTGGHSNTDHVVVSTGDPKTDRIAELKRSYQRRVRAMQPENKGEDRWDKPREPGGRRRRIGREKNIPPQPPPSGYVIFVAHMTTKIRHDRPNERHNQTQVIREISKIWKFGMTEPDREYYMIFCKEAREEYEYQYKEFRATGQYTPSQKFTKMQDVGPWVRIQWEDKNALEQEISRYDSVVFPARPPEFDEEYFRKEEERKKRRKLKDKELALRRGDGGRVK